MLGSLRSVSDELSVNTSDKKIRSATSMQFGMDIPASCPQSEVDARAGAGPPAVPEYRAASSAGEEERSSARCAVTVWASDSAHLPSATATPGTSSGCLRAHALALHHMPLLFNYTHSSTIRCSECLSSFDTGTRISRTTCGPDFFLRHVEPTAVQTRLLE